MILQTGELLEQLENGSFDETFAYLYPDVSAEKCRARYIQAVEGFRQQFGRDRECVLVSAPGRTEVGGNHTDHQHGRVLAASINLDIICVASPNDGNAIRIQSKGYPLDEVSLEDLSVQPKETGTAAALIRGVAKWFADRGHKVVGFDAYTTSDVLAGSGLSSSAAFEVAVGNIINTLGGNSVSPVDIAIAGRYAENEYFGKPSGLMDQMASSVGGFVGIDFADPQSPVIRPVPVDLSRSGFHLCIVDTRGSHADLTVDYADITREMAEVSACFGKEYLRYVDEGEFYANITRVRAAAGDRAVLRAIHYYSDDQRVPKLIEALEREHFDTFLSLIVESGKSSFYCLQNVFSTRSPRNQGLTLALVLSEEMLAGKGAWRVHGGGFAGTIQAFVPTGMLEAYSAKMSDVFGPNACHILSIRPIGGTQVTPRLGKER